MSTREYGMAIAIGMTMAIGSARPQGIVAPTSHWGGNALPDLAERKDIGFHVVGFTRFGKESDATGRYVFDPYNDMEETLGFNLLTYQHTYAKKDSRAQLPFTPIGASGLVTRSTAGIGMLNDYLPRFFQNSVIHQGRINAKDPLLPVPRRTTDTDTSISLGPSRVFPLILTYSSEYFLHLETHQRINNVDARRTTPLFVGGGWQVGTLNQEAFVHLGASMQEFELPDMWPLNWWGLRLRAVGIGGMARTGVLFPGRYFQDLTAHYSHVQVAWRATLDWWGFPTRLEFAATSSEGFFAATRTEADRAMIAQLRASDPTTVYAAKRDLTERFYSLRVRVGDFTFETHNDSYGGKDKGPSFGAQVSLNIYKPRLLPKTRNDQTKGRA